MKPHRTGLFSLLLLAAASCSRAPGTSGLLQEASAAMHEKDYTRTKSLCMEIVKLDPDHGLALLCTLS